jgi:transcriptional regulator with GAF, ATPase, and Fis domain
MNKPCTRVMSSEYQTCGRAVIPIPTSALDALTRYDWPGNIRELQNVLERSVILTNGSTLHGAIPEFMETAPPGSPRSRNSEASQVSERERIIRALEEAKGQVVSPNGAAARLGLKRTTLRNRMQKYKIARQYR